MEFFISQVEVILPVVGFDFLRPKGRIAVAAPSTSNLEQKPKAQLELTLMSEKLGYKARAIEIDGEFTVLSGSTATTKSDFVSNTYASLRDQLIKEGRLAVSGNTQFLEFKEDVPFSSASAATAVITNRNTNGRTAWRLLGSNQTLKDWQDAQISEQPPSASEGTLDAAI